MSQIQLLISTQRENKTSSTDHSRSWQGGREMKTELSLVAEDKAQVQDLQRPTNMSYYKTSTFCYFQDDIRIQTNLPSVL